MTIYMNITELIFPKFPDFSCDSEFHLNAASPTDTKIIDAKNISKVKLIKFNTCHNCDIYDLSDGFYLSNNYN